MSKIFGYKSSGIHNYFTAACLNPFSMDDNGDIYVYFFDNDRFRELIDIPGEHLIPSISTTHSANKSVGLITIFSYFSRRKAIKKYLEYIERKNIMREILDDQREMELGCKILKVHYISYDFDRTVVECEILNMNSKIVTVTLYIDRNIDDYKLLMDRLERLLIPENERDAKKEKTGFVILLVTSIIYIICFLGIIGVILFRAVAKLHLLLVILAILSFVSVITFAIGFDMYRKNKISNKKRS